MAGRKTNVAYKYTDVGLQLLYETRFITEGNKGNTKFRNYITAGVS
jgi:hypothetical protein